LKVILKANNNNIVTCGMLTVQEQACTKQQAGKKHMRG